MNENYENNINNENTDAPQIPVPDWTAQSDRFYNIPPTPKKPKPPKKYGAGVIIVSVVLAAIIGAGSTLGGLMFFLGFKDTDNESVKPQTSQDSTNTVINVEKVSDSAIEAVAEKASPSVVGIRTTTAVTSFFGGSKDYTGEGSGVIYTKDGYIITNYHVLESVIKTSTNSKIDVFLNENMQDAYSAQVIGYNITNDLAVIKIDATNLPAIELGDSDSLKKGQFVAAIGCPGGLEFIGSVSYGIISGLDRSVSGDEDTVSLIQTDAAINPGNSGGALLNIEGKLIGINSSKIAATEYEGMGFAIPVNFVKEICDNIIARKDDPTPFAGLTLSETYDEYTLNRLGYPSGAVVSAVNSDGPAEESGIRRGDIITEWGERKISDYNELYTAIAESKVGSTVKVKLYRSGRYYTTELTLSSNN